LVIHRSAQASEQQLRRKWWLVITSSLRCKKRALIGCYVERKDKNYANNSRQIAINKPFSDTRDASQLFQLFITRLRHLRLSAEWKERTMKKGKSSCVAQHKQAQPLTAKDTLTTLPWNGRRNCSTPFISSLLLSTTIFTQQQAHSEASKGKQAGKWRPLLAHIKAFTQYLMRERSRQEQPKSKSWLN